MELTSLDSRDVAGRAAARRAPLGLGALILLGVFMVLLPFFSLPLGVISTLILSATLVILRARKVSISSGADVAAGPANRRPLLLLLIVSVLSNGLKLALVLQIVKSWHSDPHFHRSMSTFEGAVMNLDYAGLREYIIIQKASGIVGETDPFSGERLLELNGTVYSVGPDGVDDSLSIIWDRLNGTDSKGDIIVRGP